MGPGRDSSRGADRICVGFPGAAGDGWGPGKDFGVGSGRFCFVVVVVAVVVAGVSFRLRRRCSFPLFAAVIAPVVLRAGASRRDRGSRAICVRTRPKYCIVASPQALEDRQKVVPRHFVLWVGRAVRV